MKYLLCRHIKTNGLQCQSPSLADAHFCYFHARLHTRHAGLRQDAHPPDTENTQFIAQSDASLAPAGSIQLAPLEDRESVQLALSLVINALAGGQLETRRATALLYGLQLASFNAAHLNLSPYPPEVVRTVHSTPEDLDLAEAGSTGEVEDSVQRPRSARRPASDTETPPSC